MKPATVLVLENGAITNAGVKLSGDLISSFAFRFRRFSTKVNIATAFTVEELF